MSDSDDDSHRGFSDADSEDEHNLVPSNNRSVFNRVWSSESEEDDEAVTGQRPRDAAGKINRGIRRQPCILDSGSASSSEDSDSEKIMKKTVKQDDGKNKSRPNKKKSSILDSTGEEDESPVVLKPPKKKELKKIEKKSTATKKPQKTPPSKKIENKRSASSSSSSSEDYSDSDSDVKIFTSKNIAPKKKDVPEIKRKPEPITKVYPEKTPVKHISKNKSRPSKSPCKAKSLESESDDGCFAMDDRVKKAPRSHPMFEDDSNESEVKAEIMAEVVKPSLCAEGKENKLSGTDSHKHPPVSKSHKTKEKKSRKDKNVPDIKAEIVQVTVDNQKNRYDKKQEKNRKTTKENINKEISSIEKVLEKTQDIKRIETGEKRLKKNKKRIKEEPKDWPQGESITEVKDKINKDKGSLFDMISSSPMPKSDNIFEVMERHSDPSPTLADYGLEDKIMPEKVKKSEDKTVLASQKHDIKQEHQTKAPEHDLKHDLKGSLEFNTIQETKVKKELAISETPKLNKQKSRKKIVEPLADVKESKKLNKLTKSTPQPPVECVEEEISFVDDYFCGVDTNLKSSSEGLNGPKIICEEVVEEVKTCEDAVEEVLTSCTETFIPGETEELDCISNEGKHKDLPSFLGADASCAEVVEVNTPDLEISCSETMSDTKVCEETVEEVVKTPSRYKDRVWCEEVIEEEVVEMPGIDNHDGIILSGIEQVETQPQQETVLEEEEVSVLKATVDHEPHEATHLAKSNFPDIKVMTSLADPHIPNRDIYPAITKLCGFGTESSFHENVSSDEGDNKCTIITGSETEDSIPSSGELFSAIGRDIVATVNHGSKEKKSDSTSIEADLALIPKKDTEKNTGAQQAENKPSLVMGHVPVSDDEEDNYPLIIDESLKTKDYDDDEDDEVTFKIHDHKLLIDQSAEVDKEKSVHSDVETDDVRPEELDIMKAAAEAQYKADQEMRQEKEQAEIAKQQRESQKTRAGKGRTKKGGKLTEVKEKTKSEEAQEAVHKLEEIMQTVEEPVVPREVVVEEPQTGDELKDEIVEKESSEEKEVAGSEEAAAAVQALLAFEDDPLVGTPTPPAQTPATIPSTASPSESFATAEDQALEEELNRQAQVALQSDLVRGEQTDSNESDVEPRSIDFGAVAASIGRREGEKQADEAEEVNIDMTKSLASLPEMSQTAGIASDTSLHSDGITDTSRSTGTSSDTSRTTGMSSDTSRSTGMSSDTSKSSGQESTPESDSPRGGKTKRARTQRGGRNRKKLEVIDQSMLEPAILEEKTSTEQSTKKPPAIQNELPFNQREQPIHQKHNQLGNYHGLNNQDMLNNEEPIPRLDLSGKFHQEKQNVPAQPKIECSPVEPKPEKVAPLKLTNLKQLRNDPELLYGLSEPEPQSKLQIKKDIHSIDAMKNKSTVDNLTNKLADHEQNYWSLENFKPPVQEPLGVKREELRPKRGKSRGRKVKDEKEEVLKPGTIATQCDKLDAYKVDVPKMEENLKSPEAFMTRSPSVPVDEMKSPSAPIETMKLPVETLKSHIMPAELTRPTIQPTEMQKSPCALREMSKSPGAPRSPKGRGRMDEAAMLRKDVAEVGGKAYSRGRKNITKGPEEDLTIATRKTRRGAVMQNVEEPSRPSRPRRSRRASLRNDDEGKGSSRSNDDEEAHEEDEEADHTKEEELEESIAARGRRTPRRKVQQLRAQKEAEAREAEEQDDLCEEPRTRRGGRKGRLRRSTDNSPKGRAIDGGSISPRRKSIEGGTSPKGQQELGGKAVVKLEKLSVDESRDARRHHEEAMRRGYDEHHRHVKKDLYEWDSEEEEPITDYMANRRRKNTDPQETPKKNEVDEAGKQVTDEDTVSAKLDTEILHEPVTPGPTTKPVTPTQPTKPVTPTQPTKPVTPTQPTKPVTPTQTTNPVPEQPVAVVISPHASDNIVSKPATEKPAKRDSTDGACHLPLKLEMKKEHQAQLAAAAAAANANTSKDTMKQMEHMLHSPPLPEMLSLTPPPGVSSVAPTVSPNSTTTTTQLPNDLEQHLENVIEEVAKGHFSRGPEYDFYEKQVGPRTRSRDDISPHGNPSAPRAVTMSMAGSLSQPILVSSPSQAISTSSVITNMAQHSPLGMPPADKHHKMGMPPTSDVYHKMGMPPTSEGHQKMGMPLTSEGHHKMGIGMPPTSEGLKMGIPPTHEGYKISEGHHKMGMPPTAEGHYKMGMGMPPMADGHHKMGMGMPLTPDGHHKMGMGMPPTSDGHPKMGMPQMSEAHHKMGMPKSKVPTSSSAMMIPPATAPRPSLPSPAARTPKGKYSTNHTLSIRSLYLSLCEVADTGF